MTNEEREKLKLLKRAARDREDWSACKILRQKIFDYDTAHLDEDSLALEVAGGKESVERYRRAMEKELPYGPYKLLVEYESKH